MNKEKEIETVTLMLRRCGRGAHGTRRKEPCPVCAALPGNASQRRVRCPHGDNKPFCASRPIYYRMVRMCAVMRYAEPSMLLSRPIAERLFLRFPIPEV